MTLPPESVSESTDPTGFSTSVSIKAQSFLSTYRTRRADALVKQSQQANQTKPTTVTQDGQDMKLNDSTLPASTGGMVSTTGAATGASAAAASKKMTLLRENAALRAHLQESQQMIEQLLGRASASGDSDQTTTTRSTETQARDFTSSTSKVSSSSTHATNDAAGSKATMESLAERIAFVEKENKRQQQRYDTVNRDNQQLEQSIGELKALQTSLHSEYLALEKQTREQLEDLKKLRASRHSNGKTMDAEKSASEWQQKYIESEDAKARCAKEAEYYQAEASSFQRLVHTLGQEKDALASELKEQLTANLKLQDISRSVELTHKATISSLLAKLQSMLKLESGEDKALKSALKLQLDWPAVDVEVAGMQEPEAFIAKIQQLESKFIAERASSTQIIQKLQTEQKELRAENAALQDKHVAETTRWKSKLGDATAALSRLTTENKLDKEKITKLERSLSSAEADAHALTEENRRSLEKLNRLKVDVERKDNIIKGLRAKASEAELEKDTTDEKMALEQKLKSIISQNNRKDTQIAELRQKVVALQAEIANYSVEKLPEVKLSEELETLKKEIQRKDAFLACSKKRADDLNRKVEDLMTEVTALRSKSAIQQVTTTRLQVLATTKEQLNKQVKSLQKVIGSWKERLQDLEAVLQQLVVEICYRVPAIHAANDKDVKCDTPVTDGIMVQAKSISATILDMDEENFNDIMKSTQKSAGDQKSENAKQEATKDRKAREFLTKAKLTRLDNILQDKEVKVKKIVYFFIDLLELKLQVTTADDGFSRVHGHSDVFISENNENELAQVGSVLMNGNKKELKELEEGVLQLECEMKSLLGLHPSK